MAATVTIVPIIAGETEEWRTFVAEVGGVRRIEWAQSQRRREITRQVVTVAEGEPALAVVYFEAVGIDTATVQSTESDDLFDDWYRERMAERYDEFLQTEVVFDSAPQPGPWQGWR